MKNMVSKIFWITFEFVLVFLFICYSMPEDKNEKLVFSVDNNSTKMVDMSSRVFVDNELIENNTEKEEVKVEIKEEKKVEEVLEKEEVKTQPAKEEIIKEEIKTLEPVKPVVNTFDNVEVLDRKENIKITGYGYDCRGCTSGKTKTGYDITETIYYEDPTFGQVRIVAADKSIPFYSIVRLSNLVGIDPIIAIVLDHGGTIGFENKFDFDLLCDNEAIANKTIDPSVQNKVVYELLRSGK